MLCGCPVQLAVILPKLTLALRLCRLLRGSLCRNHVPRRGAEDVSGVQFDADVEPLIRLVEDTSQEKILELALDR